MTRRGLLAAGNFIVDVVKMIDNYPTEEMLVMIREQNSSNGGGPYNVLKDLSAMQVDFPLEAAGLIGNDPQGSWILDDCQQAGINTDQLKQDDQAPTSSTDAMTVISTGKRTFFHQPGANALLDVEDISFEQTNASHFHLGYIMLLDTLDRIDEQGRTGTSYVLEVAKAAGLTTSIDMVSTDHPDYRETALSALPYTDVLIVNEIEAQKVSNISLRESEIINWDSVELAAQELLNLGVNQQVVIHFEEGAVAVDHMKRPYRQSSLNLPDGFIVGATGAGDAFAAGYLYGYHEQWDVPRSLYLGVCASAACLTDATPSLGLRSIQECLKLGELYESV